MFIPVSHYCYQWHEFLTSLRPTILLLEQLHDAIKLKSDSEAKIGVGDRVQKYMNSAG